MKKSIVFMALLALSMGLAFAQESNLMLGGGMFLQSGGGRSYGCNPGAVLRVSYGLDFRLDDKWSVMPGVGLRSQLSDIRHFMWVGGDPDGMALADVFVVGRYHFEYDSSRIAVGLGPALSYMVVKDTYYVDADPNDPLNGKRKFNTVDIGLQPSIVFSRGKHFQWGFEGSLGLLNTKIQYPEYKRTGSIHLHYLAVTCGWHF